MKNFCRIFLLAALSVSAFAQVPVAMAPPLHFQFLDSSGAVLANGKIFTYAAGTTTLLNTYVDAGGVSQNSDPIILDASGSPSNGTVETGIFLANLSYKFVAYDVNNVFQWSVDNVSSYFGLLSSTNLWTGANTFSQAITDSLTDNQMIFGTGAQSILDFPPPSATTTFHVSLPQTGTISDHIPTDTSTDSISNKTLIDPLFNSSSCGIVNGPGTYVCAANASPTGTSTGALTILTGAPSAATIAATTTTSGVIGITVSGSGTTGNATIQQNGTVPCIFDGATVAGDYVGISSATAGDCTDVGTGVPISSQNVGVVLSTNSGAGTYTILLNSGTSSSGIKQLCNASNPSNKTVNASTTAAQPIFSCTLSSLTPAVGTVIRITSGVTVTTSSSTSFVGYQFGNSSSPMSNYALSTSNAATYSYNLSFVSICIVTTAGASGVMTCTNVAVNQTASGSPTYAYQLGPSNTTGGSLLTPIIADVFCSFGAASASNSCTASNMIVEQLN